KYTQHLLSGTPAFHDHAHVGVRSHAGATSNQSPCFCKAMSGVPLTSDITGYPLGAGGASGGSSSSSAYAGDYASSRANPGRSNLFISYLDGCCSYNVRIHSHSMYCNHAQLSRPPLATH